MRKSVPAILLGMTVLSGQANAQFGFPVVDAERAAGRQLFLDHCAACHGQAGVAGGFAPDLRGVVGRRAGSSPQFPYSPQLRNSGITWSEANLRKWVAHAPDVIPGTPMPHVSFSDPAEQLFIVEYLKTLRLPKKH